MISFAFITDPSFGYKLLASIAIGVAVCIAAGWGVYVWLGKRTKLSVFYRLILAFCIVGAVVCLLGLISERLGL